MLRERSHWYYTGAFAFGVLFVLVAFFLNQQVAESVPLVGHHREQGIQSGESSVLTSTVFLPLASHGAGEVLEAPIWLHDDLPNDHEIGLFRREFFLSESLQDAELHIFADTRYQIWLDGEWIGRGPARFSPHLREYDVYHLDPLSPGPHVVAVLVQWAPNNRRSESETPFLQASIWKVNATGNRELILDTDSQWKSKMAQAWALQSEPVHAWDLIGPTELMDLREYDPTWVETSYVDDNWSNAVTKENAVRADLPRSIPLLARVSITPTLFDRGRLSSHMHIGELLPSQSSQSLHFEALRSTVINLEMLASSPEELENKVFLDNQVLSWESVSAARPDVWQASSNLMAGSHQIHFREIPSQGETFAVSSQDIDISVPFTQNLHAGRRLLLAQPTSDPEAVILEEGTSLTMKVLATPAYIVLDLGRTVHGRINMDVVGPSGTIIDVGWDERLWMDMRPLPCPGSLHPEWNQVDSWVLDGTPHRISTIDARSGRYVLLAVWGEGPVTLSDVEVYEERYPVEELGSFDSSNDLIDQVWQVGVDSLYPNMIDAYTDTPWRERGQWWGDVFVESRINEVAFGDTLLLERGLRLMAWAFDHGRPEAMAPNGAGVYMLDYGMLWVQSLADQWRLTGDERLPRDLYPVLLDFMKYLEGYENEDTGLLSLPKTHWSKTVLIDWLAPGSRYGQSTAVNAFYYATLRDAARLAEVLGEAEAADSWLRKAGQVKEEMYSTLYDSQIGCYRETIHAETTSFTSSSIESPSSSLCSPHAQAWALAYEAVPEPIQDSVAQSLLQTLSRDPTDPNVDIYGMYWVLMALGKTDLHSEAISIIQDLYVYLLSQGATTWWEGFNADQYYTASLSHGWGGSPTWYLTSYILGAKQTSSQTWQVNPAFRGLSWASGSLPLSSGELEVNWERESCESLSLHVSAPEGMSGSVLLSPVRSGSSATVTLNGVTIWDDGVSGLDEVTMVPEGLEIALQEGGNYQFDIQRVCHEIYLPLSLAYIY